MRNEIKQQRLISGAKRTRRLTSQKTAPASQDTLQNRDALDVAFENFPRIDVGTAPNPNSATPTKSHSTNTKEIIADIAAQLDALDRQRQRLSTLLRDISL